MLFLTKQCLSQAAAVVSITAFSFVHCNFCDSNLHRISLNDLLFETFLRQLCDQNYVVDDNTPKDQESTPNQDAHNYSSLFIRCSQKVCNGACQEAEIEHEEEIEYIDCIAFEWPDVGLKS